MASALIAVQVVLCAVIGFVTFGAGHHGRSGHSQAESLAGVPHPIPPVVAPGAGLPATGPSPSPSRTKRVNPTTSSRSVTDNGALLAAPAPSPPAKSTSPGLLLPAPGASITDGTMAPSPRSTAPEATLPTPSPTGSVQSGAVVDQSCNPPYALGRSRDGSVLICRPDTDGTLHWQAT
jgi:hypothetical protein